MTILELIEIWAVGCPNTWRRATGPWRCRECTVGLIRAIARRMARTRLRVERPLSGHYPCRAQAIRSGRWWERYVLVWRSGFDEQPAVLRIDWPRRLDFVLYRRPVPKAADAFTHTLTTSPPVPLDNSGCPCCRRGAW